MQHGKLIGIVGYAGSGKTTLVDGASISHASRIGFADPFIEMLRTMGVPADVIDDKSRWDEPLDILCGQTLRHAAITLGTGWGRDMIGDAVWSKIAIQRARTILRTGSVVIIDNVRFPSEMDAMQDAGCRDFIAVVRPGLDIDPSKISEKHIEKLQEFCNHRVINDGTLSVGIAKMKSVLDDIHFSTLLEIELEKLHAETN